MPGLSSRAVAKATQPRSESGQGFFLSPGFPVAAARGHPIPGRRALPLAWPGPALLGATSPGAPGGANAALRCSQGGSWKFEPLLGEELDLRHVTWRLPPELIPRLSASSGRSSDDGGAGSAAREGSSRARSATPRPPGGDHLPGLRPARAGSFVPTG